MGGRCAPSAGGGDRLLVYLRKPGGRETPEGRKDCGEWERACLPRCARPGLPERSGAPGASWLCPVELSRLPASFSTAPAKPEPDSRDWTRSTISGLETDKAGCRLELKFCMAGKKTRSLFRARPAAILGLPAPFRLLCALGACDLSVVEQKLKAHGKRILQQSITCMHLGG